MEYDIYNREIHPDPYICPNGMTVLYRVIDSEESYERWWPPDANTPPPVNQRVIESIQFGDITYDNTNDMCVVFFRWGSLCFPGTKEQVYEKIPHIKYVYRTCEFEWTKRRRGEAVILNKFWNFQYS